jgi:hypothetical protein
VPAKQPGIPKAVYHDLRRTALTNMIEAGFSEKEVIEISGHNTRAVFEGCGCDGLAKGTSATSTLWC